MNAIESLRRRVYPVLHPIRTRPKHLAAELEALRDAQLLAAADGKHDVLLEQIHDWLDADPDTAWPLPGVAHPNTAGGTS